MGFGFYVFESTASLKKKKKTVVVVDFFFFFGIKWGLIKDILLILIDNN